MLGSILPRDDEHQQTPELERLLFFQRREFKPRCGFTPGLGHLREDRALLFRTSGASPIHTFACEFAVFLGRRHGTIPRCANCGNYNQSSEYSSARFRTEAPKFRPKSLGRIRVCLLTIVVRLQSLRLGRNCLNRLIFPQNAYCQRRPGDRINLPQCMSSLMALSA